MSEDRTQGDRPTVATGLRLLNFGCGSTAHPEWTNLDVSPTLPGVIAHDIRHAFPFPDQSYDALYGSHVLEHLEPDRAEQLLRDCYRVLRPAGLLRVVVPDLETIARSYLEALERALEGDSGWEARYDWLILELYDQAVRNRSGGRMGAFLASNMDRGVGDFVRARIGAEALRRVPTDASRTVPRAGLPRRVQNRLLRYLRAVRVIAAEGCVALLLGRDGVEALRQGLFRGGGEVHQWMYDRFSLHRALERTGFREIRLCGGDDSAIPAFARFGLETVDGVPRKPDSMFMEARKPDAARAVKEPSTSPAH